MAFSSFLLLRRRRYPFSVLLPLLRPTRLLSTASSPAEGSAEPQKPPSSLSSRMSAVFEQLDSLRGDRQDRDEALQRIRAWRHSKSQLPPEPPAADADNEEGKPWESAFLKEVELVHPWPEWIELVERLLHQNYIDRGNIVATCDQQPAADGEGKVEVDLTRDWNAVSVAVENFGKDRFDILKSLSRKDIGVLVGHGCPSSEGKVVYSAKLLRKHAHVNEGDVCSACSLRSTCRRGFLVLAKEEDARTVDVMRVLLTFAFDSINGSVKNEPLMKMKSVKTVIRKLLHEIVKLSAVPIDPNLPPPIIKKAPPKVKQPPPPPKKRIGRDDVEMKKGDWLCPKCDFMNFAKNVICLQCDSKRPKRQLLPGEWECPQCNFLNYRRNMACFHCECKRPQDEYLENHLNTRKDYVHSAHGKDVRIPDVADAWNLDFDDYESDGADVAAYEFGDPPRAGKVSIQSGQLGGVQGFTDDCVEDGDKQSIYETGGLSESNKKHRHSVRTGFDDFDDEEDGVDNYEIVSNGEHISQISHRNLSGFESSSDFEDFDSTGNLGKASKNGQKSFSDSQIGLVDSDSEAEESVISHRKSRKKGKSFHSDSDTEVDFEYDDMEGDINDNPRRNSRFKSPKHGAGISRISEQAIRQNGQEVSKDDTQTFRRPLRGEGFAYNLRENRTDDFQNFRRPLRGEGSAYNRHKNGMASSRNEFSGSSQRFQRGKSQNRSRFPRGENNAYNDNINSNRFNDRSKGFGNKPHRKLRER